MEEGENRARDPGEAIPAGSGPDRLSNHGCSDRGTEQQAVLWCDAGRNGLRPDPIARLRQPHRPHDVYGDGTLNPTREPSGIAAREIVTARHHGDSGMRVNRTTKNVIRKVAPGVAGDDD